MKKHVVSLLTVSVVSLGVSPLARGQAFWINEFHYDNSGTDSGEFVEVVVPADFTDLASVRLTLYNGGDGKPYGSAHTLGSFTPGPTVSGLTLYTKAIGGLQNGAPDGFSLDVGGEVHHFISYEGTFVAQSGPAAGRTSMDVGFVEGEFTSVGSSIGMVGLGRDASEFTWMATMSGTPGALNVDQSFGAVVPEPAEYGLVAGAGLLALAYWQRRRGARSAKARTEMPEGAVALACPVAPAQPGQGRGDAGLGISLGSLDDAVIPGP